MRGLVVFFGSIRFCLWFSSFFRLYILVGITSLILPGWELPSKCLLSLDYMRSGSSMPSSDMPEAMMRATCCESARRCERTAAFCSRRIEWSW